MNKTIAIIGGGVSGLTAGGLLAKNGLHVKLFEANGKLGGCCANTNVGGYSFNDGALYLPLPRLLDYVFERLGLDGSSLLSLRKIIANQTATLPDGTVVTFGEGREITVKKGKQSLDPSMVQRELAAMLEKWEPVLRFFTDEIITKPFSLSRFIMKGWRHLPKLRGTVASEINRSFANDAVRAAMSAVMLYTGTPPDNTPASSMLGLASMFLDGFYLPEGGMGKIPEALGASLKNNGGEILLNQKVSRILLRNGRVCGLQFDNNDQIEVDAVVSTTSGMMTYDTLLDPRNVRANIKRKLQRVPLSHRTAIVQLGLSNRIDAVSHSNGVFPMMEEQYKVFVPQDDEIQWPIYSVPTVTMPELAPEGCSIVEMFPPIHKNVPVDEWDEEKKNKIAEVSVEALSRIHKIDVAAKRVLSPKDFRDRMHLYKGAVYGISPTASLTALFPHVSGIRGLYQAGQTTFPGYGVGAAAISGILAAEALMKAERV